MKIAIIGAGLSGIVAAKTLQSQLGNDVEVVVFEKSRGCGGRMSTRRTSDFEFDHGAQYFTAKQPRFKKVVDEAISQGLVSPWRGTAKYLKGGYFEADRGDPRFVSTPRMNSWIKALASGINVELTARVTALRYDDVPQANETWCLSFEDGSSLAGFDYVIAAIPAPQVGALLLPLGFSQIQAVQDAQMDVCFAVMMGFDREIELPWQTLRREDGPASWIAVNSSKPGRPKNGTTLVAHSGPEWSALNVDRDKSELQTEILKDVSASLGINAEDAISITIHRWLYAAVSKSPQKDCLADEDQGLIACGDWCLGGRVEGAYISGLAAAEKLINWIE